MSITYSIGKVPFQDTLQHLELSKVRTMLALIILVVLLQDINIIFSDPCPSLQLNNKVLRNIAWDSLINTCISYCPKHISLHIAVIPNILL